MIKRYINIGMIIACLTLFHACSDYLDVVPDNVATIDNAFALRVQAEKYLFTCYSYMPLDGNLSSDPAMMGCDEIWGPVPENEGLAQELSFIARGEQNKVNPYLDDYWSGSSSLFMALHDCNIFLENVGRVPDLDENERLRWIAEVTFLKAYYHFYLLRMYGPVPLIKENLSIDAGINEVKVPRDPVDSCFNYIIQLVNQSIPDLPTNIENRISELGRITKVIAYTFKAKVLVFAASPLFNGNSDQSSLTDNDGTQLFNMTYSGVKWDSAVVACRKAIEICEEQNIKLYEYKQEILPQYNLNDTITKQLSIRNSLCLKWNSEVIWANTQGTTSYLQKMAALKLGTEPNGLVVYGVLSPSLGMAEMFYSENGVPINEDKTYDYTGRYNLRTAGEDDKYYIKKDYETASLNFDREPRYYADLGFDGGIWYGQGYYDDQSYSNLFYLDAKYGGSHGLGDVQHTNNLGIWLKKVVYFEDLLGKTEADGYAIKSYYWPIIRLADLYLLYAESLNESQGPVADVYKYVNLVRQRAGLESVEDSWANYSTNPQKYTTQNGMREIIQRERLIELAFEGNRFWDLRRWKTAPDILNNPICGWDRTQEEAEYYARPKQYFKQTFDLKDYFWPIKDYNISVNRSLVQNLGW